MKLVSFSNKRPVSAEQGSILTVSQTKGKIRITNAVAKILGVVKGDYIAVAGDQETEKSYIYVGSKTDDIQIGNRLAEAGQSLEFGATNAWDELGGSLTNSLKYTVSETPVEEDGAKYWELTDKVVMPAQNRTKKGDGTTDDIQEDVVEEAEVEVEAVVDAPEGDAGEGFTLD